MNRAFTLVLVAALGGHLAQQQDDLLGIAREAKASGKKAVTVMYRVEPLPADPEYVFRELSILVAAPVKLAAATSRSSDKVFTWHVLRVNQRLATANPAKESYCEGFPAAPSLKVGPEEIAVPWIGGTMLVEGVEVTVKTNFKTPEFSTGGNYLLFAARCANSVTPVGDEVFRVLPTGEFVALTSERSPLVQRVMSFGSLQRFADYVRLLRKF